MASEGMRDEGVTSLRPSVASPLFFSYASQDLNEALAVLRHAQSLIPNVELRDYTVRIPFDAPGADAVRRLILDRMNGCRGMICLYGAVTGKDEWARWMLTEARQQGWRCALLRSRQGSPSNPGRPFDGLPVAASLYQALRQLGSPENNDDRG